DGPLDLVVLLKEFVAPLLVAREVLSAFGIVAKDAQVKRVAVERDPEFRLLGGRPAVVGIDLDEVGPDLCALPDSLVEAAVERNRFPRRQSFGGNRAPRLRIGRRELLSERKVSEQEDKQADQSRTTKRSARHQGLGFLCRLAGVTTTGGAEC